MNKLLTSLTLGCAVGFVSSASANVLNLTFDVADSINSWTVAGDSFGETSLNWLAAGGNPGGALEFGGYHNGEGAGRGYVLSYAASGLDFTGATELTFDMILTSPSVGTNVQLQILLDGVGAGFTTLNSPGPLNESTWSSYSYDLSTVTPGADSMTLNFLVAAGAFEGAGAVVALDNVTVVPEPATFAVLFGILSLGAVIVRRRRLAAK